MSAETPPPPRAPHPPGGGGGGAPPRPSLPRTMRPPGPRHMPPPDGPSPARHPQNQRLPPSPSAHSALRPLLGGLLAPLGHPPSSRRPHCSRLHGPHQPLHWPGATSIQPRTNAHWFPSEPISSQAIATSPSYHSSTAPSFAPPHSSHWVSLSADQFKPPLSMVGGGRPSRVAVSDSRPRLSAGRGAGRGEARRRVHVGSAGAMRGLAPGFCPSLLPGPEGAAQERYPSLGRSVMRIKGLYRASTSGRERH